MTDREIIEAMKVKVEEIVREKVKEDFSAAKPTDRKSVSRAIITELDKVMQDEN